ncbi:MAG: LemA family protein [Proteobacteria bacterium]|nr:LemA family protein [Pseudomonadota bacterium]
MLFLIIVFGLIGLVWAVSLYNKLVKRRNHVEDGWSGIDVQLKKRHNLIPNLVEVVKKYASHEKQTLSDVVNLRNQANNTSSPKQQAAQAQKLSQALGGLFVQVEAYPDLKADGNFQELQKQLQKVEDDIQYARRYYNGAVREYNTLVQSFPSNLIADRYDFNEAEFFEINNDSHKEAPKVTL